MKRLKHPKFFSFAMLGVVAVALAGCSQQSSSNTPRNKTVAVSSKDVISTMDSSLNTDQIGSQNLNNTMEGLYRYRGKQLKPAMATSIAQPTNNGTVITLISVMLSGQMAIRSQHMTLSMLGDELLILRLAHSIPTSTVALKMPMRL